MASSNALDHQVVVIGAGFSGIGISVALDRAGLSDYLIVEEGDGFGGTWYWNRYPGVAVDIPSSSYQFSFEKRADWSRVYAPGEELRDYAEHCAERYRLREKVRFGTRITGATFDEPSHTWTLETSHGDSLTARHIIDATGVLTVPKLPNIEGIDTFTGTALHTSRWDPTANLRGRRVAVIGTGASAIQIIPTIAPDVAHLTVFQRTPIWCMPKLDAPIPAPARWLLGHLPGAQSLSRLASQAFVEAMFPLTAHYHRPFGLGNKVEGLLRAYVRQQVKNPDLQEKLTPTYAVGCKRLSFHNDYLATYNRDNVTLETDPIARVTPTGVQTSSGAIHEVDVLVLATGFTAFDHGNFPKYPVAGSAGQDLEQWWDQHRYQAYEGVSVPGFPNYFMMFGPYAYNGSSYFNLVETQARHIVRCLQHARTQHATRVEVSMEANSRYYAEMMRRRGRQIFWQDRCSGANSYYFDRYGDVPLRPGLALETIWRSNHFPLDDYTSTALRTRKIRPLQVITR